MITTHDFDIRTDCWGGAADRIAELTNDQIDELESVLEDYFPDIPSDSDINDFIWFEDDVWKDWIGLNEDEDFYDDDDDDEEFEDFEEFDDEEFED